MTISRSVLSLALAVLAALLVSMVHAPEAKAENTSYYGPKYCGRITASGTPLDCSSMVAAHPTAPIGSVATVCYVGCVDVTIVDRGPNLDLAPAAANLIGLTGVGRANTTTYWR